MTPNHHRADSQPANMARCLRQAGAAKHRARAVFWHGARVGTVVAGVLLGLAHAAVAQPNTWINLNPTPRTRWFPASLYDCTTTMNRGNPAGRSYSGSMYGAGKIAYWGGGHASYPGNDTDLYDIATNQWIPDTVQPDCLAPCCTTDGRCDNYPVGSACPNEPYTPGCLAGSCVITGGPEASKPAFRCAGGTRGGLLCSQDSDCTGGGTCTIGIPTPGTHCTTCRPYTGHTYQRHTFNPIRGKFLHVVASGTWEWDMATREWTWLSGPPPQGADFSNRMMAWDPVRARPLYVSAGGPNVGVFSFDYATDVWTKRNSHSFVANWSDVFGFWDDRASKLVVATKTGGPIRWQLYDPAGGTGASAWTEITANVPADLKAWCGDGLRPCFTSSITYDATNQRTIVLGQDPGDVPVLWAYDAVGDSWQKLVTSGAPPGGNNLGYPNHLHYDPGTGAIFLVNVSSNWMGGAPGSVSTWKVHLNLGSPLPTPTRTPTQPTKTPTITPNVTQTRTPTGVGPIPTNTSAPTSGPSTPGPSPTVTPTCAGIVRLVGPGKTYTLPSQAAAVVQSNDCVYIDAGAYPGDVALWRSGANNVRISGVGGRVVLDSRGNIYGGKAIWVVAGNNTTVENVEFACATSRPNNRHCNGLLVGDENNAGIRLEGAGLTVRNCLFRDNDNSILGGPSSPGGEVLIEHSEFLRNGWGDGQSHNLYLNDRNLKLTYRYNYSHGAIIGHLLKSRARENYILYNRLMDETGGDASFEIDIPNGGLTYIIGNILQKSSHADNARFITYGAEGRTNPLQELYVINNTLINEYGSGASYVNVYGKSDGSTLVWSKNNVFYGATGGNPFRWESGTTPGTLVSSNNVIANPLLQSQSTYDYHLQAGSPAINVGTAPGVDPNHGYDLIPTLQYSYDRGFVPRPADATLDAGAFEYIAGATPFATPTFTSTHTPTTVPSPTATPATPVFCPAGQFEAVIPIRANGDDGFVTKFGPNYTALSSPQQLTDAYWNYYDIATRSVNGSGTSYAVELIAWRWNSAVRPDGSAWPPGTQVTGGFLRAFFPNPSIGGRQLVAEWNNWPSPLAAATAWVLGTVTASDPTFATQFAPPAGGNWHVFPLSNASTNVNLSGYTGMRLSFADGTPPTAENQTGVASHGYQTKAGDRSTQLVICYITGPTPTPAPVQPPSAPRLL